MILTNEQTTQLLNGDLVYDCRFAKYRFGYEFFRTELSPLGSILCFEYPTQIGSVRFDKAINLCIELPNYNRIAGICFERLYLTQIGSIISEAINKDCFVNENVLFIDEKQACLTFTKCVETETLLHITIPTKCKLETFFSFNLNKKTKNEILNKSLTGFNFLTKSIFLESKYNSI